MIPLHADGLQRPDPTTAPHAGIQTADRLIESAMAFWQSAVLLSANEQGLFAALAAGPCDAGTLEGRLGLLPDATADLLDALVVLGLVERSGGEYRNTLEASLFLDPAKPTYIGTWLAMAREAMCEMVGNLRVGGGNEKGQPPTAGRMWADIAQILRAGSAHDSA